MDPLRPERLLGFSARRCGRTGSSPNGLLVSGALAEPGQPWQHLIANHRRQTDRQELLEPRAKRVAVLAHRSVDFQSLAQSE